MTDISKAPWTDAEVERLEARQEELTKHPFIDHEEEATNG